ncbi:MAG: hypothetical protein FJ293_01255 [Planctomycetes bacterium]|nr:hypothetical protein [Planctomycetota bacterium]
MRRRRLSLALLAIAATPTACHVHAGAASNPDRVEIAGPGVLYATADAWRRWNGNVLEIGLFDGERDGELLSIDLGPLAGIGIGVVGLRARLLMLEVGAATLCHDPLPLPSGYGWNEPDRQDDGCRERAD